MKEEYLYRPPVIYIALGIIGLMISLICGLAIGTDKIWFSIVMAVLSVIALLIGIGFLSIFIRKYNLGKVILGEDYIEIPVRPEDSVKLYFHDILEIEEVQLYDRMIEIASKDGIHLIEQLWMKNQDFENVRQRLRECRIKSQ